MGRLYGRFFYGVRKANLNNSCELLTTLLRATGWARTAWRLLNINVCFGYYSYRAIV